MSYEDEQKKNVFTKGNLNYYLNELSKEYKRLGGRKVPVEIVLIGGAAVLAGYGFRDMTTDIDAVIPAASIMKEAINNVGDRLHLPNGWMNADFTKTGSYSSRISEISVPYKTFNQVFNVRIVTGEYLVAMKLRAARDYKNDYSDIAGILYEQAQSGNPVSFSMIDAAVQCLYGGWEDFSPQSIEFITELFKAQNLNNLYCEVQAGEKKAKHVLAVFEQKYPGVLKENNVHEILESVQRAKPSVLGKLNRAKQEVAAGRTDAPSAQKSKDDPEL